MEKNRSCAKAELGLNPRRHEATSGPGRNPRYAHRNPDWAEDARRGQDVAEKAFWWYNRRMKIKTSVTLSEEFLEALSREADQTNRSALIEEATWRYLRQRQREKRDARELERINVQAERLNEEALDVLSFQTEE